MVDWKAYKVLYNIEPEQYEISFEEFKERLTSTMNENFRGLLEEGDIIGHDGYPPFYIWTNNGMYSIGTDPFRILWKHADSRNPEDILSFIETNPNLFYRYSKNRER